MTRTSTPPELNAGRSILVGCLLWSLAICGASAGDVVSSDQILNALQPKPLTRSLSVPRPDPDAAARQTQFLNQVRNRRTRSLSSEERDQISEIAVEKPQIDLEINFDYDSVDISGRCPIPA